MLIYCEAPIPSSSIKKNKNRNKNKKEYVQILMYTAKSPLKSCLTFYPHQLCLRVPVFPTPTGYYLLLNFCQLCWANIIILICISGLVLLFSDDSLSWMSFIFLNGLAVVIILSCNLLIHILIHFLLEFLILFLLVCGVSLFIWDINLPYVVNNLLLNLIFCHPSYRNFQCLYNKYLSDFIFMAFWFLSRMKVSPFQDWRIFFCIFF